MGALIMHPFLFMSNFIITDIVTPNALYEAIGQERIFKKYLNLDEIYLDEYYINPLRPDDENPGCKFYYNDFGRLYFKDFAWRSFDAVEFVKYFYNVNYKTALEYIASDFRLGTNEAEKEIGERRPAHNPYMGEKRTIRVAKRRMSYPEIMFWKKFDKTITESDLAEKHIHPLYQAWFGDDVIYRYKYPDVAFYYHINSGFHYQLYNPKKFYNGEGTKFLQTSSNYCIGLWDLDWNKEYVVITKSYKDWFLMNRLGINVVAQMTESSVLKDEYLDKLKTFKKVFTLFDNDFSGITASKRYKKLHKTIPLLFGRHEEKDFADNMEKVGRNSLFIRCNLVAQRLKIKL